MVKVSEERIEVGQSAENQQELDETTNKLCAQLEHIRLFPNTVCGLGWADKERLFTCRVRAEPTDVPLRTSHVIHCAIVYYHPILI